MNMRSLVVLVMAFFIGTAFTGVAAVRPVHAQQQEQAQKPAQTLARLMKPWPVESRDSGGVLLLSDSPEYLAEYGILYSDVIKGDARVFYYHVNVMDRPGKLAVVVENMGSRRTKVVVERSAMPEPDFNYLQLGKNTQISYMRIPQPERKIPLEPGSRNLLHPLMGAELVEPQRLVSGMYDISASEPVKVSVVFCPARSNPLEFVQHARVLPKDKVALRGTFKGMNRTISAKSAYDPQRDGLVYIPLGDDEYDRYKHGVDATDGSQAVNYGNYGVMYRLELPTMGSQPVQVMLTPLGGVYAGAVRVEEDRQLAKVVHNPTGRLFFGDVTPANLELHLGKNVILTSDFELSHMGSYKPNRNFALQYSPPGASNLPVLLILAPDNYSVK